MEHFVVVRAEASGRYTARSLSVPEIRAEAATEAGAVEVRRSLASWLASAKLVRVEVPVNGTGNPWLDWFGRSADDPQFAAYLEEMQKARAREPAE